MRLMTITCLTIFCLVAEGQNIQIKKINGGNEFVINFEPFARPNLQTLVEYMVSDDLKEWRCENLGIVRPDGRIVWTESNDESLAIFGPDGRIERIIGDENSRQKFYKFVQTDIESVQERDDDGDFFSTVHELLNGMNPMVSDSIAVGSVSVSKTEIAAGAIAASPYQAEVTLQVEPKGAYPVKVWLKGSGRIKELPQGVEGVASEQVNLAESVDNEAVFVAGDENPGQRAIQVMTDANGFARLLLTSGNKVNDTCKVHAHIGNIQQSVSQAVSDSVLFEQGNMELTLLPNPLRGGSAARAVLKRTYKGQPLPNHSIQFFVESAQVYGEERKATESKPLEGYVTVESGGSDVFFTDENGRCAVDLLVADIEALQSISISATDLSQEL